ncbi:3-(cis-5,6-dihydroxycyclohexa-1,3-dien-1-yl)propanoate dehydrogenase [Brevundimonas sp. TWP1-2-1b1]|uniref:3-(cis-5,6-dihydroxycyclohexa-1, 3-dien-1-yl)propanoate dehydrogenase n=1 Tax=unclassified Brevundimonas TaxID=2622653 RepID=UPI003CE6C1F8
MQLKDQVALVTGGGSGLGLAIVERFVEEGARVAVFDRSQERIEEVTRQFGDRVVGIAGDVRDIDDNHRAVDECLKSFEKLDTFVGNAGIWDYSKSLISTDDRDLSSAFDEMFGINVKGYVLGAKAALPALYKTKGHMIFTASNASFYPGGGGVLYTATKHAVVGMIKQMAHEFAPYVRVNGVAPGGIGGSNLSGSSALAQQGVKFSDIPLDDLMKQMLPLERAFKAHEYAGAYVFLANRRDNTPGTGGVLNFDGGIGMRGFASPNMGVQLSEKFDPIEP